MTTTIAIESKPVILYGFATPYQHLYLVKTVTDADGKVTDELVIRGDVGGDLSLVTQADIPLARSADARPVTAMGQHHHTVLDLGGRDPDAVWDLMVQHAVNIDKAGLPYGVDSFGFDNGGDVNSNTVVASALHTVGINLAAHIPAGVDPGDLPLFTRIDAMHVNDVLTGGGGADVIFGGVGNDLLRGNGGNDRLFGETGTDTLLGGAGDDSLDGGAGADRMDGGAGSDLYRLDTRADHVIETDLTEAGGIDRIISAVSLSLASQAEMKGVEQLLLKGAGHLGGSGNDLDNTIWGTSDDNRLSGGLGDDILFGGSGNDSVSGGNGSDTLRGGAGDDHLVGGVGRDVMKGDAGHDVFEFAAVSQSAAGAETRDMIVSFESVDRLDLSKIDANTLVAGNQSFAFIGSDSFTAAGQVRFAQDGLGNTLVQADVNGDHVADFEVFLRGYTHALDKGDFVL